MSKYSDDFNWKAAEADVEERGGDLDMLYTHNTKNRDSYLRELELNPNRYAKSSAKKAQPAKNTDEGCYIATCVYGSYDCPEVWTLRRFRDEKLLPTAPGRWFVKCYYKLSPKLVARYGGKSWFVKPWRSALDLVVRRLETKSEARDL